MSLANDKDLIIPDTVGIISAAAKEANLHFDRKLDSDPNKKSKDLACYIRDMEDIHKILQSRIEGIPLKNLVPEYRLSNARERVESEEIKEKNITQGVYESWFKES